MSIGYHAIMKLRRVEEAATRMGFRFAHCKHRDYNLDVIALYPRDDKLPNYSRDAELFSGDLREVEIFLRGIEWSNDYLKMLRLITDEKIERKEQDVRNKQLVELIKGDEAV